MRSTTFLALALPTIAAFPLDEAVSSKHSSVKRVEPAQGGGKWTQWDVDSAAMDGSKWAHPKSHDDGSEWAEEGWPESAKGGGDWSLWDEAEDAMDGSRWGPTTGRVGPESPQESQPPVPSAQPPQPDPAGTSGERTPGGGAQRPGPPLRPVGLTADEQQPEESPTPAIDFENRNGFDTDDDAGKEVDAEPVPAPQPPQPAPSTPATGGAPSQHAQNALAKVNELRKQHGSPPLTYDTTLEAAVQQLVDRYAAEGKSTHVESENIWAGSGTQYTEDDFLTDAVMSWYEEEPFYAAKIGYKEPTKAEIDIAFGENAARQDMWGHFTQMVWKSSSRLGCAKSARTDSKGVFYVACRFKEGGNAPGQYEANVKPKGATA